MSQELKNTLRFPACSTYSLGFANRLTNFTAERFGTQKESISALIHEMLAECAARQNEEGFNPVRAIQRISDQIAQTVSGRDSGPLISYIDTFPEPDRAIMELRMEGLSYREIAQRLGLERDHVLEVLASRTAAMVAIDACAQPIKRTWKTLRNE